MADDKQVDFVDGVTAVVALWLDRMQEVQQPLAWNLNLSTSGTSVILTAGSLESVSSLVIKGKMRYVNAPLSVNFIGQAAGTYGIWANTTSDDSDPTFTIVYVSGAGTPSGITYTRKIATVFWTGSALQDLTVLSPYQKHSFMHRYNGPDALPAASVGPEQLRQSAVGANALGVAAVQGVNLADEIFLQPQLMWQVTSAEPSSVPSSSYVTRGQALGAGTAQNVGSVAANQIGAGYADNPFDVIVNSIPLAGFRRQYQLYAKVSTVVASGTISGSSFTIRAPNPSNVLTVSDTEGFLDGISAASGGFTKVYKSAWIQPPTSIKNGVVSEQEPSGNLVTNFNFSGGTAYAWLHYAAVYMRYVRI